MPDLALPEFVGQPGEVLPVVVQRMGNWKDRRMLARYAHLSDTTMRDAAEKPAAIVSGAPSTPWPPVEVRRRALDTRPAH